MLCSELPRILHHELEVVIAVDRAAHSFVILAKLFECHDAVGFLGVPLGHEVLEDFVGGLPAFLNIGVLAGVVNLRNVGQGHLAILIDIKLVVGSLDPDLACFVDFSLYAHKTTFKSHT